MPSMILYENGVEIDGQFTRLPPQEMKLLGFLYERRWLVETNEIAYILGIDPSSVKVYVHQIRDRLGYDAIKTKRGHRRYMLGDGFY